MLQLDVIAVGRLKKGPFLELFQDYERKIRWSFNLIEVESRYKDPITAQNDENMRLLQAIQSHAFVIALDERGNGLKSLDFASTIENLQNSGEQHIQFILGGADGLQDEVRNRANMLLSFGQQTWPHMMARVMVAEQIYRAQQILAGHPYHRE